MDIKVGVGISLDQDATTAGKEAVKNALQQAGTDKADFMLVFASSRYEQQKLLDGIKDVSSAPMVGGSTAGEISNQGPTDNSVVIAVINSKEITFYTGLGENINKGEVEAGAKAAFMALEQCKDQENKKTWLMFPDGLSGDGRAIIQGVYNVLGEDFEIVGGVLGDDAKFQKTYQYYNGQVYNNAVVGVLVCGDVVTGCGIRAGWSSIGNRMRCTKSVGTTVYELDNKPALELYKRYLGPDRSERLPAIAFEYPFGIIDEKVLIEDKEYLRLRTPLSINEESSSMNFGVTIAEGTDVAITSASRHQIIEAAQQAALQAKSTMGGAKPLLILDFASVGRKFVLGPRSPEEIRAIRTIIGDHVPMIGFYTYGEIGPIDKRVNNLKLSKFHNQTTLLWVLGSNVF